MTVSLSGYAGAMTKLVVVALGALLLVAGCGPAAMTPASISATGSMPPSTAPASSVAPTGRTSPSSTANGSPVAGGPLVERALKLLQGDTFIGHVDQVATATSDVGGKTVEVRATMSLDVSGPDLSAHVEGGAGTAKIDTDVVIVGRLAYTRSNGGAWKVGPRAAVAGSITSLIAALTLVSKPTDLRDAGLETIDGRSLHHLTAASTIPYSTSSGTVGTYDTFDFYVGDDGTPVLFKSAFTGKQGATTIGGTIDLRYSRIGGPIAITAPTDAPAPSG